MTLQEVKSQLGINTFNLNTATAADGTPTDWYRHWENDTRVAVSIHKDLVANLQNDPSIDDLALQTETRSTDAGGEYTAQRIVKYKAPEVKL